MRIANCVRVECFPHIFNTGLSFQYQPGATCSQSLRASLDVPWAGVSILRHNRYLRCHSQSQRRGQQGKKIRVWHHLGYWPATCVSGVRYNIIDERIKKFPSNQHSLIINKSTTDESISEATPRNETPVAQTQTSGFPTKVWRTLQAWSLVLTQKKKKSS